MRVVDLRREAGYPLSAPLLEALERVVERGDKAILLLNRRGVAPALHCRACGTTIRCTNCDVALVLHGDGVLRCHHCGSSEPAPEVCPACASAELARIGAGTQRLERELEAALPRLTRFRLDADTVEQRGVAETLRAFGESRASALIGTQMVAKGHHFSGVALAAVVDADTGLGLPDFRAEERTFQLLTQLAGRSGRDAPGRVLVQTFQPDASAIELAARHDVAGLPRAASSSAGATSAIRRSGTSSASSWRAARPASPSRCSRSSSPACRTTSSGRRRCSASADAFARSSSRRRTARAPLRRRRRGCSRPRRRRCAATGSPPSSTSIRNPSNYTGAVAEEVEGQVVEDGELDAETAARRQLALAQVRQYGDPVLRMRAHEVTSFDEDLKRLVTRMQMLMHDARGVGLAATQVGILQRVFVFQRGEDDVIAVVNPVLSEPSDELATDDEGCLSMQGVTMPVERHLRLDARGTGSGRATSCGSSSRGIPRASCSTRPTTSTAR